MHIFGGCRHLSIDGTSVLPSSFPSRQDISVIAQRRHCGFCAWQPQPVKTAGQCECLVYLAGHDFPSLTFYFKRQMTMENVMLVAASSRILQCRSGLESSLELPCSLQSVEDSTYTGSSRLIQAVAESFKGSWKGKCWSILEHISR